MMHLFCMVKRRWRSSTLVSVFLLDVLFLFWVSSFASGDVVGSDKSVLLKFKSSVSDPSGILSGWNSEGGDHCSWFGVACDRKSRVLALNVTWGGGSRTGGNKSEVFSCSKLAEFPFYGFGIKRNCSGSDLMLAGTLSSVIGNLTELRVLSLPFNGFTGEIPVEIWNLSKLEVLDLEGNFLTGTLPFEFNGLRRLRVLNLGFNQISGGIPSFLSNCVGLQILNLAGNQLSGTIPGFVNTLSELKGLYLSFNRLHGSVPYELGNNCKNLEHLDLSGNSLHGEIPRGLGNCSHLQSLLLFSNMLEGVVPPEFGRLRKLEVLDLSRNNLTGLIPAELGDCGELSVLVLSIKYNLPLTRKNSGVNSSFEPYNAAYNNQNKFQGDIPVKIFTLSKLRILWAPRANLQGKFPSDWGPCDSLEMVNLAQNFFMGEIPEVFGRCKHLHFLDLSSNNLTGELSSEIPVPCMTVFDISGNHLSGIIPRFSSAVCPHISSLAVHLFLPNDPSSAYTSFFMHKTQTLIVSPFSKASGGFVILHNFGSNNFSGPLPLLPVAPERLNKETTYAFLVGGNNFNGSFFGNLFTVCGKLKGLMVNVSSNNLSEGIPADVGAMCRSLVLLDASRNLITGTLPVGFGDLDSLSCLDLSWNTLQGQVPVSLGRLKGLKYLSLAGNNLTGFIPSSLGQLHSLLLLDLSSNFLSGEIPKELVSLRNLDVLLLNNNNLSGHIPTNFVNLTSLSTLNVSFNNLSGHNPRNNSLMGCSSVLGNPSLQSCFFSLSMNSVPSSGSKTRTSGNNGLNPIEIASIASATAIVSILLALIVLFFYTRKCAPKSRVPESGRREFRVFTNMGFNLTFDNVVRATRSFNPSNCIGNGGFGATYKAELSPGVLVAVKRLSIGRCQGIQQFHAEIKTLGRIRHKNLVTLLGYHASETEMFLIYNYLPGGNLEKFIEQRAARAVDWRILHKIALDIARALAYLHEQCVPRVLHRDVKPSNILLDNDYNAYLSDFGLARLLGISETHATTGVAGTFGYVAPEYAMTCRVSDKADVYSYGVVLLELFSDKKALDPSFSPYGNGFNIVDWACMLIRHGRAKEFFSAGIWDAGPQDNLVKTLHLGIMCTANSLSNRPKMKQVFGRLKHIQPTPAPGTAS